MPDPTANVTSALAAVMADLPAIGKDSRGPRDQGGYAYRGIEAITKEASVLLAKHGVVFVPQVVAMEIRDLVVNSKPWTDTILTVRYRICGPGGPDDCVEAIVVGIGRDNSDKGANKAMTQAFKYALIQTLCIADQKDDTDGTTMEADAHDAAPIPEGFASHEEKSDRYNKLRDRIGRLDPPLHAAYVAWRDDQGFTFPYTLAMCVAMEAEIDRIVDEAITAVERGEEPLGDPQGSTSPPKAAEPPSEAEAGAPDPLPDPAVLDEATEAVAELTPAQVDEELRQASLPRTGSQKDKRARLAVHLAVNAPPVP